MKEHRTVGPPGCGKTTWVAKQARRAAETYGSTKTAICSLTRSAAANIAGKDVQIPKENIGTLHSLAYRALPGTKIAETKLADFNEFCGAACQPQMKLGETTSKDVDEDIIEAPAAGATNGDTALSEMNRLRARMVPRDKWPSGVVAFAALWERWKKERGYLDFTDLLEICLRDVAVCPGNPAALFVDESQDCSRLAFSLARKWGEKCLTFVHVGDCDQILYHWAGVTPDSFFETELPPNQIRVLSQSYRVPQSVHAVAMRWIDATPGRARVSYAPRQGAGSVRRDLRGSYQYSDRFVEKAAEYAESGKTFMFLCSCAYMLAPIVNALKDAGIPFHNPYRVSRGDWNQLRIGSNSPAARLAAFLQANPRFAGKEARLWNNREIARWSDWLNTKTYFVRGAKAAIKRAAEQIPDERPDIQTVLHYFEPGCWEDIVDADPEFWLRSIDDEHRRKVHYPARVLGRYGLAGLKETPKVIVSTIHAAKGGEADGVALFPDLSPQGYNEWLRTGPGREGVRRAFYVGMTRAREDLYLCQAVSNQAVRF